jgi:hypothetical protein
MKVSKCGRDGAGLAQSTCISGAPRRCRRRRPVKIVICGVWKACTATPAAQHAPCEATSADLTFWGIGGAETWHLDFVAILDLNEACFTCAGRAAAPESA